MQAPKIALRAKKLVLVHKAARPIDQSGNGMAWQVEGMLAAQVCSTIGNVAINYLRATQSR